MLGTLPRPAKPGFLQLRSARGQTPNQRIGGWKPLRGQGATGMKSSACHHGLATQGHFAALRTTRGKSITAGPGLDLGFTVSV